MYQVSESRSTLVQVYHPQHPHSLLSGNVHRRFRFGSCVQYQTCNNLTLRDWKISIHADGTAVNQLTNSTRHAATISLWFNFSEHSGRRR